MKALLLYLLLAVAAAPAIAQTAPESLIGSIAALDAKDGFRKFKFGTPISELPTWERRSKNTYVDNLEPKLIGDVELNTLKFQAYQDKFAAVTFTTNGSTNCQKLLDILRAQYGEPQKAEVNAFTWTGNKASIYFLKKTVYGYYGTKLESAIVMIYSNQYIEASKDAELDKNQKASGL